MKTKYIWLLLSLMVGSRLQAQDHIHESDSYKLPKDFYRGVLKNGFTYYLANDPSLGNRVQFIFIEKAGRYHQEEGEENVAHFVEHMSFRATKNFPQGLRNFMVDKGLRGGESISGSTNDFTRYYLFMPKNDSSSISNALQAVKDWSNGRLYLKNEVEQERLVVLREADLANNDSFRALKTKVYLLLDKNPYYKPSLSKEIENAKAVSLEKLVEFDAKWYTPKNQALIVIGNVDRASMISEIDSLFSRIDRVGLVSDPAIVFNKYNVPLLNKNTMTVLQNRRGDSVTHIEILKKRKAAFGIGGPATPKQLRLKIMDELFFSLMENRLNMAKERYSNSIKSVRTEIDRSAIHSLAALDALTTAIDVSKTTDIEPSIKLIASEFKNIQYKGFREVEFVLAKQKLQENSGRYERTASEISQILANHFTSNVAPPPPNERSRLLETISLEEFNSYIGHWIAEDGNTQIVFSIPTDQDSVMFRKEKVFSWIDQAKPSKISTRTLDAKNVQANLKTFHLLSSKVSNPFQQVELPAINSTKIILKNGIEVILKPLPRSEKGTNGSNTIALEAFRPGGSARYGGNNYAYASICADLIAKSGLSNLDRPEFDKWLNVQNQNGPLFIYPYMNNDEVGFKGSCTSGNIENLLHLAYLYFTEPRIDNSIVNNFVQSTGQKSPRRIFNDSIDVVTKNHLVHIDNIKEKSKDVLSIYRNEFKNIKGFKFVIAGAFDKEEVIRLINKYLGSLKHSLTRAADTEIHVSAVASTQIGNSRIKIIGDAVGNVQVRLLFPFVNITSSSEKLQLRMFTDVLRTALFKRLRQKDGAVYTVVATLIQGPTQEKYFIDVVYETDSLSVDGTVDSVLEELGRLKEVEVNEFSGFKVRMKNLLIKEMADPLEWAKHIIFQLKTGENLTDVEQQIIALDNMSPADFLTMIKKHLLLDRYFRFELI